MFLNPPPMTPARLVRAAPDTATAIIRVVAALVWSPRYATTMSIEAILHQLPDRDALLVRWLGLTLLAHLQDQEIDGSTVQVALTWRDDVLDWGASQLAQHDAHLSQYGHARLADPSR